MPEPPQQTGNSPATPKANRVINLSIDVNLVPGDRSDAEVTFPEKTIDHKKGKVEDNPR